MLRMRMASCSLDRSFPRASLGCCSEVSFSIPLSEPSAKFFCRENNYACLIEFPILPSRASFCLCSDGQCHLTTRTSSATRAIFVEFASIRSEPGKS